MDRRDVGRRRCVARGARRSVGGSAASVRACCGRLQPRRAGGPMAATCRRSGPPVAGGADRFGRGHHDGCALGEHLFGSSRVTSRPASRRWPVRPASWAIGWVGRRTSAVGRPFTFSLWASWADAASGLPRGACRRDARPHHGALSTCCAEASTFGVLDVAGSTEVIDAELDRLLAQRAVGPPADAGAALARGARSSSSQRRRGRGRRPRPPSAAATSRSCQARR